MTYTEDQIRHLLRNEKDPLKRWDIICDKTPHDKFGIEICKRLEQFALTLPGGLQRPDFCRYWKDSASVVREKNRKRSK